MTAQLSPTPIFKGWANDGQPLAYGRLTTYAAGSTVKQATYTDSTQTQQLPNPIQLNFRGETPIWLDPSLTYKFVLTDFFGNTIPGYPVDNIPGGFGALPISASLIPHPTNTWTLGNSSFSWANLYLGPNEAPAYNSSANIIGYYGQTSAEIAAAVTPVNYAYAPGDIRRYGANSTSTDNGPFINAALLCNPIVFDGNTDAPVVYEIQTSLKFQSAGQILKGNGFGDSNTGNKFAPRTTLKWTGATNGIMILLSDGVTANWSETTVKDLFIDGNGLLNKGIAYDDSIISAPGCWRNSVVRIGIANCTNGTQPSAIYLGSGAGAGGFCNDPRLQECYLWNCGVGVWTTGAVPQLFHCTIGVMSIAGLYMSGVNSLAGETKVYGGVFHSNVTDILVGAVAQIQNVSCFGTWFENSTAGIFVTNAAFSLHMMGCHLHTLTTGFMFNFNIQPGHVVIKCWAAAGATSYNIINPNTTFDYDLLGSGLLVSGTKEQVRGLVNVDNSKFRCALTTTITNATGDGSLVPLNANPVTVLYNLTPPSLTAATGIFTASATLGLYRFDAAVELSGVLNAHNDAQLLLVVTGISAQTYIVDRINPGANLLGGGTEVHLSGSISVPMNSGDTAYMAVIVSGSTKVVNILASGPITNFYTTFCGQMC